MLGSRGRAGENASGIVDLHFSDSSQQVPQWVNQFLRSNLGFTLSYPPLIGTVFMVFFSPTLVT